MNGFHDAANAIATVVSTGVLKPQTAVAMAALFNFVAIFTVGLTWRRRWARAPSIRPWSTIT
jgi:phosphate/sulfate permease